MGQVEFGPQQTCQSCGATSLQPALFIGYLPPVNKMISIGDVLDRQSFFPAELVQCSTCSLIQLSYAVEPELLFPPEYPYTSGSTRILRENFAQLRVETEAKLGLRPPKLIVDIGSNDGTLLINFLEAGYDVFGIDPTDTAQIAQGRGIRTMQRFFGEEAAAEVVGLAGRAALVTAANVFAHILDVHGVLQGVKALLDDDGVFISESHYVGDLIETLQYDTIYHEHLRYYSVTALKHLLGMHDLEIFDVARIPTHGGSIRVYSARRGSRRILGSVGEILTEEASRGLTGTTWIADFRRRVLISKLRLVALLSDLQSEGAAIAGIGAPSRASTLITHTGLDEEMIRFVGELPSSQKVGKYMPGTRIEVVDEKRLFDEQPSHALLLSWHIAGELMDALKSHGFRGDFIVPLPDPHVVRNSEV